MDIAAALPAAARVVAIRSRTAPTPRAARLERLAPQALQHPIAAQALVSLAWAAEAPEAWLRALPGTTAAVAAFLAAAVAGVVPSKGLAP
ncbi:MAG: hypothetical protein JO326_03385 [Acetobacteraceae bacterium]|nr:hypothetical protein [Acetobacteraceae bacterium]